MSALEDCRRYESRMKARGYVRKGVRIPADAAEQLEELAYRHRMTESEVIARLLLGQPLQQVTQDNPHGLSESELRFARMQGYTQ